MMKTKKIIQLQVLTALCLSIMLPACYNYEWDFKHETALSKFEITSTDETVNIAVNYADSTKNFGSNTQLLWEKSAAEDFSKVFYEVLFYNSTDTQMPVHTEITGKGQTENFLVVNEKTLNIIAEKAGIAPSQTGDVLWKVRASNGINETLSGNVRKITLTRPAGFAYYPEKIIIGGAAVGEKPLELKRSSKNAGEYEIFLFLQSGNFYLTEKGSNRRLFITENGELQELFGAEKETLSNSTIEPNKIHRIKINLKNVSGVAVAIENVAVWYSGTNDILGEMQQENANVPFWALTTRLELVGTGAQTDYRYKLRVQQKTLSGEMSYSFWGYSTTTAPNQNENTPASYFYLYEADNSQSNFCYKFSRTDHNQHTLRFDVDFRPETENFTHKITVIE